MAQQIAIPISDLSQVGKARRAAAGLSELAGLDATQAGQVAIIVTELATNLARYGQNGQIILSADSTAQAASCEIIAIDTGPGMNVERCLTDGYSTGGTSGTGLGAVRRQASEFDIYSADSGSVVLTKIRRRPVPQPPFFQWGCINLPTKGEDACGDSFGVSTSLRPRASFMIADGLGHGPDAAAASACAAALFADGPGPDVVEFIASSHQAMVGTRGAALAIATLNLDTHTLSYAGVGNIAGVIIGGPQRRGLPSQNGIVGAVLPKVKAYDYPLPPTGLIVMHSDGLHSRWTLDPYPGLASRHPALIAALLYRDFYRGRDDVTVLTAAWHGGSS